MSTTVGQIGLNLVLNTAPFKKSLSVMQSKSQDTADKISGCFKKAAATVAATVSAAAVARFGKSCIELGSDLAEVQNVVDVTFNKLSGAVNKWSKEAAASYGLSETMAKKYVGTFGSMAEAFGFTEQQAYDMSTTLTGLTGDVASFYNIDQDLAYTKLKSVFSGETETLKDLGIVMTQSALDQYALANGVGKTTAKMTEAEKVTLRYKFVQDQLKNATGDFARTQDSWANQTRILQLRFDSLKATIGQGLINAFNPVLKVINSLIGRVSVLADKFKAFTDQIFGNAGDGSAVSSDLADASNSAGDLASNADTTSTALNNVADKADKAKRSIAGFDKLNVLSSNDTSASATDTPSIAASTATSSTGKSLGSALSNAVDGLAAKWDAKGKKVIDSMKNAFSGVKSAVIGIGDSWKRVWSNGTGEKVIGNIKKMLSNIFDIIGDISTAFQKAWNDNGKGDAVIQSIIDKFNSIIELINTIGDDFREVWNSGVGERIWGNILTIIENCNNATKTFRDKIKEAWEKNDTGKKIWQDILGLVEDISTFLADMSAIRLEFLENLDLTPLAEAAEKLLGAFRDLAKAVTDKLKDAYKTVLLPLAKWTIEKAVPKLVEALAGAFEFLSKMIQKIEPSSLQGIAAGVAAIGTAIVVFKSGQAIASGIDKVKKSLKLLGSALESHPYVAIIAGIASAIMGLATAIKTANEQKLKDLGFEKETEKMNGFVESISACKDTVNGLCDDINTSLADTASEIGVTDEYKKRLDELLSKTDLTPEEQAELTTIGDYFSNKYPDFKTAWDKYVKQDDYGKLCLVGNVDDIKASLDTLIDKYKQVAASNALSELSQQNAKVLVSSRQQLNSAGVEFRKAQKEMQMFKDEWDLTDDHLNSLLNSPDFYTWQNKDASRNAKAGDLKSQYNSLLETLDKAEVEYNGTAKSVSQLMENSSDLSAMQAVINGNYSDAAAVLMAYNSGLITTSDIQNSEWESLSNLESAAKESGNNLVFGLTQGTSEYYDEIAKAGLDTADMYLSSLNGEKGLDEHSPSKKTYRSGVFAVTGLVNGIRSMISVVAAPISQMIDRIKTALSPLTNIFHNIFGGIWDVIKGPINTVMSGIESFINGIINGVKNMPVIDTILSKFGWSIGDIGELKLPRFAKGAIVKAPTLAVVGDNPGANTGNPEVIAPLNKLKAMIGDTTQQSDNKELLNYLKRIYEMLVINRNNGGNNYEFVAKLQGSVLFDEIVKQNEMYKKSHGGQSAFA